MLCFSRYFILLMAILPSSRATCEDTLGYTPSPIKDCVTLIQSGFPCGSVMRGTAVDDVCRLTCGLCYVPTRSTYLVSVDLLGGEQGYYQFEGISKQHSPDIEVTIGETLVFDQADHTNYFHPLGFSFSPDGFHGANWDSKPPKDVEVGKLDNGADDLEYDAKFRYYIDGVYGQCDRLNRYDCYEDGFFMPKSDWRKSSYRVELDITKELADKSHGGVIFYFCRIHSKMSGKIIIKNTNGTQATGKPGSEEQTLYTPAVLDSFDKECGTWGLGPYEPGVGDMACDNVKLICGEINTLFKRCLQAMDCAMFHEMRTMDYRHHYDPVATFMHQMIPHHMNAVNMGRLILKIMDTKTLKTSGLEDVVYSVINAQMYQIHFFRKYLGTSGPYNEALTESKDDFNDHMHGPHCDYGKIDKIKALETWPKDKPFTLIDDGRTSACQPLISQSFDSTFEIIMSTCDDNSDADFIAALAQFGGSTDGITGCVDYLKNSDDRVKSCNILGTLCKKSCGLCPTAGCFDKEEEFSAIIVDMFLENNLTSTTCAEYIALRALESSEICGRFSVLCPVTCNTCDAVLAAQNAPVPDRCISTSIDLFQSDTGYYQFGGQEYSGQYQPEVHVTIGERLAFEQFDHSNWMNPISFTFHPDDVATESEWTNAAPIQLFAKYAKHYVDGTEVDRDTYQRLFRQPRDTWRRSNFRTYLNVTQELTDQSYGGVIYYMNGMLRKMSGKIVIHNKDGSRAAGLQGSQEQTLQPVNLPNAVDQTCGTYGLENYISPNGKYACSQRFFCGDIETVFEKCLHAIDCKMHLEMRTTGYDIHGYEMIMFSQQMIPHHMNAINMAKTLLSYYKDHSGPYGVDGNIMPTSDRFDTLYEVMFEQTQQIQKMKQFLATQQKYQDHSFDADSVGPHCEEEGAENKDVTFDNTTEDTSGTYSISVIGSVIVLCIIAQLSWLLY